MAAFALAGSRRSMYAALTVSNDLTVHKRFFTSLYVLG